MNSTPIWSTQQIPNHAELHDETLSQKDYICIPDDCRIQKTVSELQMEAKIFESYFEGAGDWNHVLCKSKKKYSSLLNHLISPLSYFYKISESLEIRLNQVKHDNWSNCLSCSQFCLLSPCIWEYCVLIRLSKMHVCLEYF